MSQMYPALSRSKKSKSNRELLDQLKAKSLNWYEANHQGYKLPGTLEPHSWCGSWSWKGCLNAPGHAGTEAHGKGFVKTFQKQCFRSGCEKCAPSWISRESNKSASRLKYYQNTSNEKSKHIVISPPAWIYDKPVSELKKEVYQILKRLNAKGGCLITHPFREDHKQKTLSGKISWISSIHFHVVGYGWLDYGLIAENFRKSGWIVKNKGTRESNYGTIRYILSHAGVKKGYHALTWFGDLSYSKLKVPEYENELNLCPYCTEKMVKLLPTDSSLYEPPPQMMECIVDPCEWFIPECPIVPQVPSSVTNFARRFRL